MFKIKPNSTGAWIFYWISVSIAFIVIPFGIGYYGLWSEVDHINLSEKIAIEFPWGPVFMIFWYSLYCGFAIAGYNTKDGWHLNGTDTNEIGMIMWGRQPIIEISHGFAIILPFWFKLRADPLPMRKHEIWLKRVETATPDLVQYEKLKINRDNYEKDELHVRMSVGAKLNIFSILKRGEYANYLTNVGSDEKFLELVPNITEGFVAEEFSKRTPAVINSQREEINGQLKKNMQKAIDAKTDPRKSWGLEIEKIQLFDLILPDVIVDKMMQRVLTKIEKQIEIVTAQAHGQVTRIDARAEKYKAIQLGIGKAEAERLMLEALSVGRRLMLLADATGYGKIAKELNMKEGEFILQMEMVTRTLKEVMPNSDYTFVGSSDFANMFGFMKLIQGGLSKLGIGGSK